MTEQHGTSPDVQASVSADWQRIFRRLEEDGADIPGLLAEAEGLASLSGRQSASRYLMACCYALAGRNEAARRELLQLLSQEPGHTEAIRLLAEINRQEGHEGAAITQQLALLSISRDDLKAQLTVAEQLQRSKRHSEAVTFYRRYLERRPDDLRAVLQFALALLETFHLDEAEHYLRQLVGHDGGHSDAWFWLGNVLMDKGEAEGACNAFLRAIEIRPDFRQAFSSLLFLASYRVLYPPEENLRMHRRWAAKFAPASHAGKYTHPERPTGRPLRVGYVSADFRQHSVSYFIDPVLAAHDRERCQVFGYSASSFTDQYTRRIRSHCDTWRDISSMSNTDAADLIFQDDIDVLVDLSGHTAGGRLGIFSYRPARVQVTYLGYFTTTGLDMMDYWISDDILTPEDTVELATEEIWRLPGCSLSYSPLEAAPPVNDRLAPSNGVVLGSFNDLSKVSPETIRLWSNVLHRLPEATFMIKARQLSNDAMRNSVREAFRSHGIPGHRIRLVGRTNSLSAHLEMYGKIDIALDTVPRTGGTTTVEALWMGVPVVTLAGDRYIERLSATMLHAAGLKDWVCADEDAFIRCVVGLAGDTDARNKARNRMRSLLRASPLFDGADLAHRLEDAYTSMMDRSGQKRNL